MVLSTLFFSTVTTIFHTVCSSFLLTHSVLEQPCVKKDRSIFKTSTLKVIYIFHLTHQNNHGFAPQLLGSSSQPLFFFFYSTGFDWQADCCEFRCQDTFPLPLWAISHVWPEVRMIYMYFFSVLLNISGETDNIRLAPGDCTNHTQALAHLSLCQ